MLPNESGKGNRVEKKIGQRCTFTKENKETH